MQTLAFLMLDGPTPPQCVLVPCAIGPAITILLSWLLLRISRKLLSPAVFVAFIAGLFIIASADFPGTHKGTTEDYGLTYVVAVYTAAIFPFLAILGFYIDARSRNREVKATNPN